MDSRRALSIGAVAAVVAMLLAAFPLAGERSSRGGPAARTLALRPLQPPGARIVRDRAHALRVALPRGWQRARGSLTPRLAPPGSSVLAVATFPARARPRGACGNAPDMPQVPIGPRDALLHVGEELDAQPGAAPRRARVLRLREQLRRPPLNELVASVFPWRCLNRPGIAGLYTSFRARGRLLHITAVAGERTSARRRRELVGILQSLRVGPPPPVVVRVHPRSGRPATRFRLVIVATHRSGRRGRRDRAYWAAVHGPPRTACVIENAAWFSNGPPGAWLRAELDPSRTKGRRWCRGRFSGVVRYRDGLCRRNGECWRVYTRIAGRFRFIVR